MPAGACPSIRPARSVPGKTARQESIPLRFLAACGVGGTRGYLASVLLPLHCGTAVPGATFNLVGWRGFYTLDLATRRRSSVSFAGTHHRLLSLVPVPFWRGSGLPLGNGRGEGNSYFGSAVTGRTVATLRMSGSGGGSGGGNEGGAVSASRDVSARSAASEKEKDTSNGGEARGNFPAVTLDADAVQKFAEIEVRWGGDKSAEPTILIRGLKSAKYHVEAAEPTMERLRAAGIEATITGGGRIKHSSKRRSIFIYGYSMQFGPANLPRVAELCREQFGPEYEVDWTEGGY